MIRPYRDLTQSDMPARNAVAILPLAAVEVHGPHLPLGTDAIIADGMVDRAAALDQSERAILQLPILWLGASTEHANRAGTLSREPEALIADIIAVGAGLATRGISRAILFNAHGGNIAAASIAALKLRTQHQMLVASVHWLDFGLPPALTAPAPVEGDVHGGWMETSILLHLAPQTVKAIPAAAVGRPPAPSLFPQGRINWGWMTSDIAPDGYVGRPDLATAAIGKTLVDHAAERLNALAAELAGAAWPRA